MVLSDDVLLLLPDPIVQSVLRTARDSVSDENEHRASQSTKPVDQARVRVRRSHHDDDIVFL